MAEHYIEVFENERADFIVAPSGSCTAMVRNFYHELFHAPEDAGWRERFSRSNRACASSRSLSSRNLELRMWARASPRRVTYHDACHLLRELGIAEAPRRLIRAVRDVEYVELEAPDTCCGFGGTFSVKYAEISNAILEEKLTRIANSGAEYVVANDSSCLMQIAGGLSRAGSTVKTMHLAELLAKH